MKPENEKKLVVLAHKYPAYFAYLGIQVKFPELPKEFLWECLGENMIEVLQDMLKGKEEIFRVTAEIEISENEEELSDEENEFVDNLIKSLKK
jgi:hypothetical protein